MKPKRVVAWAVVDFENTITGGAMSKRKHATDLVRDFPEDGERVVKLVEADPSADAVVRAAVKLMTRPDPYGTGLYKLRDVVERYERRKKR